jgi:alkylhydroperoxidase family enzyme
MTRIPYIDDAIIPQAYGLKGTINLLRIVYHSPKVGEAFAHIVAAEFTGLALSPKLRELLILHTAWHAQSEYANASAAVATRNRRRRAEGRTPSVIVGPDLPSGTLPTSDKSLPTSETPRRGCEWKRW